MKFGYSIPSNQGFEAAHELVELAAVAEVQGFDSVWAPRCSYYPGTIRHAWRRQWQRWIIYQTAEWTSA
jgi:hypothetical protein